MSQFTKREMLRAAQSTALLGASTGGKPADARAIAALGRVQAIAALGLGLGPSCCLALARACGEVRKHFGTPRHAPM